MKKPNRDIVIFNEAWFDFVFCEKKRKEKNENCEKKMLTYTQYVVYLGFNGHNI